MTRPEVLVELDLAFEVKPTVVEHAGKSVHDRIEPLLVLRQRVLVSQHDHLSCVIDLRRVEADERHRLERLCVDHVAPVGAARCVQVAVVISKTQLFRDSMGDVGLVA